MNADELKAFVQGMTQNVTLRGVFGGTEMMETKVLWEGTQIGSGSITFADSLWNYDMLVIDCSQQIGGEGTLQYVALPSILKKEKAVEFTQYGKRYGSISGISDDGLAATCATFVEEKCASYLKKVIGIKFTSRIEYSTEEQCIGTWLNGKPLYQKTFEITNTISTTAPRDFTNVEHGIDNIDAVTSITGVACRGDNMAWYPIGMADTDQTTYTIAVRMNSKYISYYIRKYSVGEIKKLFVTAQYTKTTD